MPNNRIRDREIGARPRWGKKADDFYGKTVILAARTASQAGGGEIPVSSLLKELTESGGDTEFGEGREVELRGLAGPHQVHQIQWE